MCSSDLKTDQLPVPLGQALPERFLAKSGQSPASLAQFQSGRFLARTGQLPVPLGQVQSEEFLARTGRLPAPLGQVQSEQLLAKTGQSPAPLGQVQSDQFLAKTRQPPAPLAQAQPEPPLTKAVDVQLFGMQPGSFIVPAPKSGQALGSTTNGVLISPAIADQGIAIGDRLSIGPSGVQATVIGETADASYSHIGVVYAPLALWQQVHYGLPGPLPTSAHQISALALNLAPGFNTSTLNHELGTQTLTKSASYSAVPGYSAETGTMTLIRAFLYFI